MGRTLRWEFSRTRTGSPGVCDWNLLETNLSAGRTPETLKATTFAQPGGRIKIAIAFYGFPLLGTYTATSFSVEQDSEGSVIKFNGQRK